MKKILILLFFNLNIFSQSVEVKYYENIIPSSTIDLNSLPRNIKVIFQPNLFSYLLTTDGKLSLYENEKIDLKFEPEISEHREVTESGDTIVSVYSSEGFDIRLKEKLFFKDFLDNKTYEEYFNKDVYKIIDSIPERNWEILNETKEILGFTCQKAITTSSSGIKVIAWFTAEIPISDGPYIYCGLPGLILKISQKNREIIAYDLKLSNDNISLTPPVFEGKVYDGWMDFVNDINKKSNQSSFQPKSKFNSNDKKFKKSLFKKE